MKSYIRSGAICVLLLTLGGITIEAQKSRTSVSAAEVTGTFRMNLGGKFRDISDEIQIASVGRGGLRISMELFYPTMVNGERGANSGSLDGEATIVGDTPIYSSNEFGKCTITIKFVRPGFIKVSQEGTPADCGFGFNVMADGTYRKVSSRKPTF